MESVHFFTLFFISMEISSTIIFMRKFKKYAQKIKIFEETYAAAIFSSALRKGTIPS